MFLSYFRGYMNVHSLMHHKGEPTRWVSFLCVRSAASLFQGWLVFSFYWCVLSGDLKTSSCLTKLRKLVLFTDKLHPLCVKQVSRLLCPLKGLWQYLCIYSFMILFYFTAFSLYFVVCSVLWHNIVNILRRHHESVISTSAYLTVKPYSSVLL